MKTDPRPVLAFDADDTLWFNEHNYRKTEQDFCRYFAGIGTPEENYRALMELERDWMLPRFGYGARAFTLTMTECAVRLKENRIRREAGLAADAPLPAGLAVRAALTPEEIRTVSGFGEYLMTPHIDLPDTVAPLLGRLRDSGRYRLVLATKGDLQEQMDKLDASGLEPYFDYIQVMVEKDERNYLRLCRQTGCPPERLTMVGNSFRSDIIPVLRIGGRACYIPSRFTWFIETVEEFEHPRLHRLDGLHELESLLEND